MICGNTLNYEGLLVICEEDEDHDGAHHAVLGTVCEGDVVNADGSPAEGTAHLQWWTQIPPPQRMVWYDIEGEVEVE